MSYNLYDLRSSEWVRNLRVVHNRSILLGHLRYTLPTNMRINDPRVPICNVSSVSATRIYFHVLLSLYCVTPWYRIVDATKLFSVRDVMRSDGYHVFHFLSFSIEHLLLQNGKPDINYSTHLTTQNRFSSYSSRVINTYFFIIHTTKFVVESFNANASTHTYNLQRVH